MVHFRRFLVSALLHPISYASIFYEIDGLMKIHNRGNSHEYSIWGCQIINFSNYNFRTYSASMKWPFLGAIWAVTLLNIVRL